VAKAKDNRRRLGITASEDEMKRFEKLLKAVYPYAKPTTAARMLFLQLSDNIGAVRELVTNVNQCEPMVNDGSECEPMESCPSPAGAHGSSSGSEEEKNKIQKKNKKGNSRIAPLDVSEQIIGYLAERTGVKMRPEAEGHRRHIQKRLNKGATVEEMLEVIRKKADEWVGTDMARHLTPKTLFGENFDGYLDQLEVKPGSSGGRKGLAARLAEKQGGFFNGKW
jgi:uncharacterized phage protein (TIGR02220 family)